MAKQEAVSGVSGSEFARSMGVHASYISRLKKEGRIPILSDGSIDPVGAAAAMQMTASVSRQAGSDYRAALVRRTNLQSAKLQRELLELNGTLLNKEDVLALYSATCSALKQRLRLIPSKMALRLAQETRPAIIQAALLAEIDGALELVCDKLDELAETWGQSETNKKAKKQ